MKKRMYIYLHITKNKNTMYTVHIYTDGSVKKSFNFPTIEDANQSVQRHASEMNLDVRVDQDGWAFAYDPMTPSSSPFRDEIFIFEII